VNNPEQFLRECPFGRLVYWNLIPPEIFEDVFDLVDEGFNGWVYYLDEFDRGFYKYLEKNVTNAAISRLKWLERQKFKNEMDNMGESG
jgi:hypothetical protein